jgi:hypothetical protein
MATAAARCFHATMWLTVPCSIIASATLHVPLSTALASGFTVLFLTLIVAFACADANLGLLIKGSAPAGALQNKRIVVVGASRGFGAALAKSLAERGAVLVLSARDRGQLEVRPLLLDCRSHVQCRSVPQHKHHQVVLP